MGTHVASSKGTRPGHRPFEYLDHRRIVAEAWDVPVSRLPDDNGPGPVGVFESSPSVVWIATTNLLAESPGVTATCEVLDDSLLVVQGIFRSGTVELADVVFPAATRGESKGTTMSMEQTVSRVYSATETPPGVRQDLDIIADAAARAAPGLLPRPSASPSELFDRFAASTGGIDADCLGLSCTRLDSERAVR